MSPSLKRVSRASAIGPRVNATWLFSTCARTVMSKEISTTSPIVHVRVIAQYAPAFTPSTGRPFTFTVVFALHAGMRSFTVNGSCFTVWFTMRTFPSAG